MFHNIFSKSPINEKEKVKIVVDDREKNSLVPTELIKLNLLVVWEHLPIGDYLLNNSLAVERKTVSDLKSSIINKRIFTQLSEIKQYEKYFLLIEGPREELFNNQVLNNNAIRGFFLSTLLDFSVPILFSENEKESAILISVLANKKYNNLPSLRPSKLPISRIQQQQYILEGFPGIGPKTAQKLLEKFKSLKNIFLASQQDIKEILGSKTEDFLRLMD